MNKTYTARFGKTKSVKYYCCPVCQKNSTDRAEIEKHFRESHQIKTDEVIYCTVCGAGWHVNAYGKRGARERAENCFRKHQEEGNADEVAALTFFLSGGNFGYVKIVENEVKINEPNEQ